MTPWEDPAWRADADAWLEAQAARLERAPILRVEQPHVHPWGTVLRAVTTGGVVWLKATAPELRHEAALTDLLARRRPELVPPLLASDVERGWLLTADAGTRLRELAAAERSLERWLDVLPLYAQLQLALVGDVDELLAAGVPDLRLDVLPARFERLLDEVAGYAWEATRRLRLFVPRIRELCEKLGGYGIPPTIQHDDLHDGQVFVADGRYSVIDWGDACVSHPFFTLAVTLEGVVAWGLDGVEGSVDVAPFRDAYLAPFAEAFGERRVVAAAALALPLGWACRAANGHVPERPDATHSRLRMLLAALSRPAVI